MWYKTGTVTDAPSRRQPAYTDWHLPQAIVGKKLIGDFDSKPMTIATVDNHVYFYSPVDSDRCLDLLQTIMDVDNRLRNERLSRSIPEDHPYTPIWLHIHSYGGSLFTGLGTADKLAHIISPVYTVVEGCAASAATLLSIMGARRYILPNSFMLIHQLSTVMWGTHEEFKDEMALQEMAMGKLAALYAQRTNRDEDQIREMLKRDTWMDAETCLQHGFVDEIIMPKTIEKGKP